MPGKSQVRIFVKPTKTVPLPSHPSKMFPCPTEGGIGSESFPQQGWSIAYDFHVLQLPKLAEASC